MLAGSLEIELLTNMARLTTDMAQARQSVGTAMSAIEKSVAFAKAALVGLGAVGLAAAFANNVRAAIDLGDSLNKLTQRTGVSVEALSQLQYAAKMADVSTDSLTTGLKKLNVSIAAGASGDKEKIALFKALGITVTDAAGSVKKADTVLMEIADTFAKSKDGAGKTAIAVALLGKAGDEMIPLLNGGSTALRDMMVEADKLGLTIGTDFAAQAEEFNDNLARVQASSQKLTVALAGDLVSGLGKAMKAMADATIEGGKLAGVMAFLQSLLTGDDRYKNDKAMVEQTEEKLRLENSLAKMEAQRNSGRVVNEAVIERQRAALEKANSALNTTIAYRKVLQGEDDASAAAAKRASDAQSKASELRLHNSSAEAAAALAAKEAAKQLADQQKLVLELNGLSGSFTKDWNDLSAVYARGGLSLAQFTEAQAQLLAKQPAIKKASEDRTKAMLAEAEAAQVLAEEMDAAYVTDSKAREQGRQAVNDYAKSVDESNAMLQLEQSLFGQSERDRAIAIAQYQAQIELKKQLAAIDANSGFDETQREELRVQARAVAARAGAAAVERAGLEENVRVLQSIDSTAHDVFVNVFDNGSNAFKRLGQTLKASLLDLLYQMTIKKWIINIGASVTGAGVAGQAAAAATDGTGSSVIGAASNLSSIYSATSSMVTLGSQVVAGTMSVANALGTVAANATGTGISGLLAANGAYGTAAAGSASALAGSATSALAAIPGVGWAALAAVAVASIFGGRGSKEAVSTGIEGSFGAGGFNGNRFSNWKQDGGWFHSDRNGKDTSGLDAATAKQFTDAYAAVQMSARQSAVVLGLSADAIAGYSENISVILTGDAAKDQEIVTKLFSDLGNHMALAVAPGLAVYAKEGEGASATMDRLATSLVTANALLEVLGQRVFALSLAGGDAASKLADAFGGLDKLATATQQYYDLFFSDAEKLADTQTNMAKALAGVNLQLPTSKEGFRALAESLDLNTDAGRAAYATLLAIAPQFASTADAMAKTAAEAASKLFEGVTRNAVIDFDALARALDGVDVDTFAETVSLVFENLADRIKSVLDNIATERGAVAQAMDQILNPATMSKAEIQRGIASAGLAAPNNSSLVAAQRTLGMVDAEVERSRAALAAARAQKADRTALDTAAGTLGGSVNNTRLAQAAVDNWRTVEGGKYANWMDEALRGNDLRAYVPNASAERNGQNIGFRFVEATRQQIEAQQAYETALASFNAAQLVAQAPVEVREADLNIALAAQAAAANAARDAQLAYIASLQDFTIDAGKSVSRLSQLREETLKYYEAQKQLADLMTASAASLREAVRSTRMGQLDSTQSLAQRQAEFAQAYSMGLVTEGANKAGYADKLAAALPDLSAALADTSSTRAEWVLATAQLFAQSATIADQLEATAPTDHAAESLALLQTIDATLAALDASTMSAERIIAAAVAAGSDRTAAGLRAVIAAITGQSIPAFASGGMHAGGVRLVGENGPEWEATGASRIYNSAQMRAVMGSGDSSGEALLEEMRGLRDETRAIAFNTGKVARILDKVTPGGTSIATHVEEV